MLDLRRHPAARGAALAATLLAVLIWCLVPVTHCAGVTACGHCAHDDAGHHCCHHHRSHTHEACEEEGSCPSEPREPQPHSPEECPLCQVALTVAPAVVAVAPPLVVPAVSFAEETAPSQATARLIHVLTDAPPRGPPSAYAS
jgi:hypothetical protein